jgi:SAM-dependent methyltransferase
MTSTRIEWALELLAAGPDDDLLEFGCGSGVAAERLLGLGPRSLLAIDRSGTAVGAARRRLADQIQGGRVRVERRELAALPADRSFTAALGINVNLFWTGPAVAECQVLRAALGPPGRLLLVYEAPGERADEVADRAASTLRAAGFDAVLRRGPASTLVALDARPAI